MKKCCFLLLLIFLFSGCSDSVIQDTVVDKSGLLSPQKIILLQEFNADLLKEHDIDFRLILEEGNLNIAAFNSRANRLMAEIAKQTKSTQGRVILLYIDTKSDLSRFEISGDLEGIYTDIFSGYIQQQHMVYFFRERRLQDGILAASEMIYQRAQDASLGKAFTEPKSVLAGGGGASTEARLSDRSAIPNKASMLATETIEAGDTPMETVIIYKHSMAAGNSDPDKDIFTDATQKMMRQWTVTPAQQSNGAKGIERCSQFASRVFFSDNGELAVVRYPTAKRKCNPWFLQKKDKKWRLDLLSMQQAIGFNQKNQYHFKNHDHAYSFAFSDLRFDKHGYPHD